MALALVSFHLKTSYDFHVTNPAYVKGPLFQELGLGFLGVLDKCMLEDAFLQLLDVKAITLSNSNSLITAG